jgi:hypothetical protein
MPNPAQPTAEDRRLTQQLIIRGVRERVFRAIVSLDGVAR